MAIVGLACSVSAALLTVLLILIMALADTAGDAAGLLILGAVTLWVLGLVLSVRAGRNALRHHTLAKVGTIISVITAGLFVVGTVVSLVMVIVWFLTDPFAVGMEGWGGDSSG